MKYVFFLISTALLFTSCKKEMVNDAVSTDTEVAEAATGRIGPAPALRWTKIPTGFLNVYPYTDGSTSTIILPVGDEVYMASGTGYEFVFKFNKATQKFLRHTVTNPNSLGFSQFIPGHYYLFSQNGMIYGGMADNGSDTSYIFALDPISSNITQKARFPGIKTTHPVSFQIGNKGYVISGSKSSTPSKVWEYDFAANTWMFKGNSPLGNREGAVAFVINNKVYMGLGYVRTQFNGEWINIYKSDWIQYTPGSAYAAVKADFPGETRFNAMGYVLDDKAWLGFGIHTSPYERMRDFWSYNALTDTWHQEENWPGTLLDSHGVYSSSPLCLSVFTDGNLGYAVKGNVNQLWRYSSSSIVAN